MSNLDIFYDTLREWRDRFPNILCVSISLFDDGEFRIHVDWKDDLHSVYVLSEQDINSTYSIDQLGENILREMERQYRIATVGEE
jgi:hypothetical protein